MHVPCPGIWITEGWQSIVTAESDREANGVVFNYFAYLRTCLAYLKAVVKFIVPDWGDKVDYGIWLSYSFYRVLFYTFRQSHIQSRA
jgi:hypothetical protein